MLECPTFLERPDGTLLLNPLVDSVKGSVLVPQTTQNPITVAAAVSATAHGIAQTTIEAPTDAWCIGHDLVGLNNGTVQNRILCALQDNTTYARSLMNRPVLFDHVFGTQLNPFFMSEYGAPLIFQPRQTLDLYLSNPSMAGAATLRMLIAAEKAQRQALKSKSMMDQLRAIKHKYREIAPYWLTTDSDIQSGGLPTGVAGVTLAASATADAFFTAKSDVLLILTAIMARAITAGAAGDTNEVFSFQVFDARTERPLQNQAVTLNTGAGISSFPYILPSPLFIAPNNKARVRFTNLITDASTDIFFTFFGVALFGQKGDYSPDGNLRPDPPPLPVNRIVPYYGYDR